jgi:Leucine-rich repeat (LRR) protein
MKERAKEQPKQGRLSAFFKVTTFLLVTSVNLNAQNEYRFLTYKINHIRTLGDSTAHVYKSIEEGLKEPEKVLYLDLRSHGLESFPIEILKFKNLKQVYLGFVDAATLDSLFIWDAFMSNGKGPYNPNTFARIPLSLAKATNLTFIDLTDSKVSSRNIRKLRKLMPFCEIIFYDYPKGYIKK